MGVCLSPALASADPIVWVRQWDAALLQQAAREHRFVLLDLHAVWCHWCHVMDEETYTDPHVRTLIADRYLPVSIDADGDPGLTSRYGDWGWPATVVLAPDGTEIVKRRGYIAAPQMASLLQAIIDDPSPGPSIERAGRAAGTPAMQIDAAQRSSLLRTYDEMYDEGHGGWGEIHKFVDAPAIEFAFAQIDGGDSRAERRVRQTLDANLHLIDGVWGGVYQYSDSVDWLSPHFEKLMAFQADDLQIYSEAFARWGDPRYLAAARALRDYMTRFLLGANGAFYVSQDADLSAQTTGRDFYVLGDDERRRLGIPRVDTHEYARENGWAVRALCRFYDVTGAGEALRMAERAVAWVVAHRALAGGGFRHDTVDEGGPFLEDSVAMGDAFLALYRSTGDRRWLARADAALGFIAARLREPTAGFMAAPVPAHAQGVFREPVRAVDQNVAVARFANLVYRYTGRPRYQRLALHAMKFLANVPSEGGVLHADVLLADRELSAAPTHITIVGASRTPRRGRCTTRPCGSPHRTCRSTGGIAPMGRCRIPPFGTPLCRSPRRSPARRLRARHRSTKRQDFARPSSRHAR
jgi:uncharacterized protein YyaL (SSP411 family)